ncbi:larval serum protein 1 beta chain-like [Anthonomus grandis grandis]|uniref:larval serum protein 1 beta chain-like n=1 Tax=Anthonomus grandis grandis TaxID=2921223 RepID=UPI0021668247|nr:larval serum protein 1 beta chain-like [Anthonomus grandis grandis]
MKLTIALVCLGLGVVLSSPVGDGKHYKTVDHAFLEKQQKVLSLFKHIHQHSVIEEHVKLTHDVTDPIQWLQVHKGSFEKPQVVDTMIQFFHYDYMVPKGHPFSIMYDEHLEQAIALFKLFEEAKDFDTFYHTAVVMKKFVNEGMWLYSVCVAIVHRDDTHGIILPPIYEVYPWFFYNTDVIHEAYKHKMAHKTSEASHDHHIIANYSGHYLNLHWEQALSYYTEDVGLNAFFHHFYIYYPFWMDGEEYHIKNDNRGNLFLDVLQSLLARYYLERLSHGEGQIPNFDWDVAFETPYYPSLQYPNGLPFPERPKFANLHDYFYTYGERTNSKYAYSHKFIETFERRLMDAIDGNYIYDLEEHKPVSMYEPEKHREYVNKFGNLLQCNPDSPNPTFFSNYTTYATHLLGYSYTPLTWKNVAPSALQHPATAMRDPAFYQLIKKMLLFYVHFQHRYMTPYHKDQLVFPGVSIDKVEMDRLITYFDEFYSDISNVVYDNDDELKNDEFKIWAVQKRLNHKPFTYKIYVNSNQDTQAMVKVFLGPKYDEFGRYINISENRLNFVPIDAFKWHLKSGQNVIKRSSQESEFFAHDRTTYSELYKKVMTAYKGQGEFHINGEENYLYFPDRLMLPMGSHSGTPYQFYFIVYPFKEYSGHKEHLEYYYPAPGQGGAYVDDMPIFYPFDKPIKFGKMFVTEVPNSCFYETKIYLRTMDEAQVQPITQHQH